MAAGQIGGLAFPTAKTTCLLFWLLIDFFHCGQAATGMDWYVVSEAQQNIYNKTTLLQAGAEGIRDSKNNEEYFNAKREKLRMSCKSGKCTFNKDVGQEICGDETTTVATKGDFLDGKSCDTGEEVPDETDGSNWSPSESDKKYGQESFGKNCKSGKCSPHPKRTQFICGSRSNSRSVQAGTALIVVLLCLLVAQN